MPMIGTIGRPVIVSTEREFAIKNAFLFELHGVHIDDDVAAVLWRGRQLQHKAGVEVFEHLDTQFRFCVMAFVDDKHLLFSIIYSSSKTFCPFNATAPIKVQKRLPIYGL